MCYLHVSLHKSDGIRLWAMWRSPYLRAGVGAVLAMTHSVLVETTRRLFGAFYGNLAQGMSIAGALDRSRLDLRQHSWRGDRRWGTESFALHLQDWFLPALYQSGLDSALLLPYVQPVPG